ncbi:MAG TPA: LptA/OstA family protein [Candidatus Saccharimonadales bacterium]|nr:LptA/OstA family protein [Candidatus Saccharimonadales bacterium]
MKRSEAAQYARWSAIAALVLALITGGYYMRRQWVAFKEKKQAPPPLTEDKERQSIGLTLSKGEGARTVFTLQASKSTDFKGQDISLLEDVKVTVFGKTGERHDIIHTQSCRYSKADGAIQCAGNVQIDLQSAADFARAGNDGMGKGNIIHVETSSVTFERGTGRAQTVQPVHFTFSNGEGDGVGAVYFSEDGALRLVKDVRIKVRPTSSSEGGSAKPGVPSVKEVLLTGTSLDLGKLSRKAVLSGPATATTHAQELTAGEFTMLLDPQFHAQTLIAQPGSRGETPKLVSTAANGPETLTANEIRAELAPEGWVRTVDADGNVRGNTPNRDMIADHATVEMWPKVNESKLATLRGSVMLQERDPKDASFRRLTTSALQLTMSATSSKQKSTIEHAETLDRGAMEWTDAAGAVSKLSANKLLADFSAAGKAQHLTALGNVETQRDLKGRPTQTATAENGEALLDDTGGWSQLSLHGKVRLREGERSAESQQAVFVHANQTAVLTGQAVARDASSETRATKITFHQDSGETVAEGKVRSTDLSSKKSGIELSPVPANISADRMVGNTKTGKALYTGQRARLWQGPSVLEADSIELLRDTRVLNAVGNVRATFPQASGESTQPKDSSKPATVWHVSSGTLTYWDQENRAHLEKNVVVQSTGQRMRGPVLDLYFTRPPGPNGSPGTSQIERAVSTGGVVVEQGDRRGTAENGVYTAADDQFVLSGGTPTLYDAEEGATTGNKLTFNLADDTIIVDSATGSRTLTKHRVQR